MSRCVEPIIRLLDSMNRELCSDKMQSDNTILNTRSPREQLKIYAISENNYSGKEKKKNNNAQC